MLKNEVYKLLIKNKGSYLSGQQIADKLNVSRTAVWKVINSLKEDGFDIRSKTNMGYYIFEESNLINKIILEKEMLTDCLGKNIIILDSIDSTNNYLKEKADVLPDGTLVIAKKQTGGKGRFGRKFESPEGTGLYMSVLIKSGKYNLNFITILSAVAVHRAIFEVCKIKTQIKWVNDIHYNGKKLCGILTEATIEGETGNINNIILGIGINTGKWNELPEYLEKIITTLEDISCKKISQNKLCAEVLKNIEMLLNDISCENGIHNLLNEYKENLNVFNKNITVVFGKNRVNGYIKDITETGALMVIDNENKEHIINSGEIIFE